MTTDLRGRQLAARYQLEERLASGGMATVWRAHDRVLARRVAVKILHPELTGDAELFERFRREAVAAARLSHPHVLRVFDTGVDDGACFIVMELFEGRSLAELLAEERVLDPPEAVRIARDVLDALAHAHQAGVVHRDVKPANILVDASGLVKVTDFGIAKAAFAADDLTTTGRLLGTARYLAPEQIAGEDIDHRVDLYAVGAVLYELLTGRPPFQGPTAIAEATMRLTVDPRPPGALRAGIPRRLDQVVLRALARDPARRFATAHELSAALDRLALSSGARRPVAQPVAAPSHAPGDASHGATSFIRSWILIPALLILLAAAAVGTAGVLLGRLELQDLIPGRAREPASTPPPPARPWPVVGVADHDPLGDEAENPDLAGLAADDDAESAWQTEGYESADLGGLKDGVGLVFDLGAERAIGEVRIEAPIPGWRFEVRASDDGEALGDPVADVDGATSFVAGAGETRMLPRALRTRYVVVWITEVAPDGDRFRAAVAEAVFFPRRG